ncbi:MAG: hypothetical protein KDI68_14985 [Gammaproteobacteria bacterium]|nr:hypothetical protein [Gammaproteobacteria bacterium]
MARELVLEKHEFPWLRTVVIGLVLLNALDGILTIVWVETGYFTEANPLMDQLLQANPVLFISVKMLLVCLGILLLWRCRERSVAVASIFLCFGAYLVVMGIHLDALNILLAGH